MKTKIVQFYSKNVYGRPLEFVIDPETAAQIASLTGRKTVTAGERQMITALADGSIVFEQVLEPAK